MSRRLSCVFSARISVSKEIDKHRISTFEIHPTVVVQISSIRSTVDASKYSSTVYTRVSCNVIRRMSIDLNAHRIDTLTRITRKKSIGYNLVSLLISVFLFGDRLHIAIDRLETIGIDLLVVKSACSKDNRKSLSMVILMQMSVQRQLRLNSKRSGRRRKIKRTTTKKTKGKAI
jgi:hypothetical protein